MSNQQDTQASPPSTLSLAVDIPTAARLLGISTDFCYRLARQQKLPVTRLGDRLLVSRAGLEALLEPARGDQVPG